MTGYSGHTHADFIFDLTRTYHRLMAVSERLHGEHGLSAGARSILLLLHLRGNLTLSEIAGDRAVSRQFIQRVAAPLIGSSMITKIGNPKNRRSSKLALSKLGQTAVDNILRREAALLEKMVRAVPEERLEITRQVLNDLDRCLDDGLFRRDADGG